MDIFNKNIIEKGRRKKMILTFFFYYIKWERFKSGIWQLLPICLMCFIIWFCHSIRYFLFWIFLGVQYFSANCFPIGVVCFSFWFCLIWDIPFGIYLGVRYFCCVTFFVMSCIDTRVLRSVFYLLSFEPLVFFFFFFFGWKTDQK